MSIIAGLRGGAVAFVFALGLAGCSDGGGRDGEDETLLSCVGSCGGQAPGGCYCDLDCASNGDCCEDAEAECTVTAVHGCNDSGGDDGGGGGANEVCFPGPNGAGDVCLPLSNPGNPNGYNYPSPLNNNYRAPIAYLDLQTISASTQIAPNFKLSEVAQEWKGRWAVVQPHAITRLQALRGSAGALKINSGYRSPKYNTGVGGATRSRHMYGDAFDIKPLGISVNALEPKCTANGGFLVEYSSHVHCDWRNEAQDPKFFGAAALGEPEDDFFVEFPFSAEIAVDGDVLTAPARGFDEGEPARHWVALAADGSILAEHTGPEFIAPSGTHTVEVDVGRVVEVSITLD